ncbi:MAG TPA: urea ABC transporter ATP-binding protein UrtD [Chloroflexota bacterium]
MNGSEDATVLSLSSVRVSFDGLAVLDGLDFSMQRGELRFLIGPNGAGKTTMLDVISGRTRPLSGKLIYDGAIDLTHKKEHELAKLGIARKFQTPSVFGSLTVFENLEVAVGFKEAWPRFFRPLSPAERDRISEVLEITTLNHRKDDHAAALSHGELQWLEIGMLLVQDPKLLLLDEPVAGMTGPERDKTGAILRSVVGTHSILVVEHDMAFVREFANTVSVMHLGKILSEGPMEQVQSDPRVVEVYLGHRHDGTH